MTKNNAAQLDGVAPGAGATTAMQGGFASIPQMIAAAKDKLAQGVRDHIDGAAGTEVTLKRNRLGLECLAFRPRVLRDVSEIDTGTTLLGHRLRIPVVIAPIGSLHTITPLGAVEAVRAAGAFGVVSFTSSVAEPSLEEIAAASAHPKMFQLYIRGDSVDVAALIGRVKAAGYAGIAVTVDFGLLRHPRPPASAQMAAAGGAPRRARIPGQGDLGDHR